MSNEAHCFWYRMWQDGNKNLLLESNARTKENSWKSFARLPLYHGHEVQIRKLYFTVQV